jgi:hypothetical protein
MHIQTTATDVRVTHRMTGNIPKQTDLFIEVDDLKGTPVAAFSSGFKAATWLRDNGFTYVPGSQGLWSKRKAGGGLSLERVTSTDTPSQPDEMPRKFWQRLKDTTDQTPFEMATRLLILCGITLVAYKLLTM